MAAAPAPTLQRRNVTHAVIWCVIAVIAVVVLSALRQAGQRVIVRYNNRNALNSAWQVYESENVADAQKRLYLLLQARPELKSAAMDRFGGHLLALPRVFDMLSTEPSDPVRTVAGTILAGDAVKAAGNVDALEQSGAASAELLLWRARYALQTGDIVAAEKSFRAYWDISRRSKSEVIASIAIVDGAATPAEQEEYVNALLAWGLLDEAATFAQSVSQTEQAPMLTLCEAIQADRKGDTNAARGLYEKVLAARPANLIASARMASLSR